jgi:hypothetical protein
MGNILSKSSRDRRSQDDLIEIENWPLDTRGDHPMGRFHDTAEASSQAAGHAALHGDLNVRSAIGAQRIDYGSQCPVHWFGTAGIDLVRPLNEVPDHLGGQAAVTSAPIVGRNNILDSIG